MKLGPSTAKLLELGSEPLIPSSDSVDLSALEGLGGSYHELATALRAKNGFYAFESALHVFPWEGSGTISGIQEWNSDSGWRSEYGRLARGCLFFAEDAFGGQFCLKDGSAWQFDPETGDLSLLGKSLEEWAQAVLSDFEFLTGHPVASQWQVANGALPAGKRLAPRIPFVLGGDFSMSNLILMDSERGMRIRGGLATQINSLPDGAQIRFVIDDEN